MIENGQSQLFHFFFGLGLLAFAWSYIYRKTRVDRFREDLFTIRDELFDYMWRHDLPFNLRAYRLMRDLLNGMIRAADKLSFVSFLIVNFSLHRKYRKGKEVKDIDFFSAFQEIEDDAHRRHFKKIFKVSRRRLLQFVFYEGIAKALLKPIRAMYGSFSFVQDTYDRVNQSAEEWATKLIELGQNKERAKLILGRSTRAV